MCFLIFLFIIHVLIVRELEKNKQERLEQFCLQQIRLFENKKQQTLRLFKQNDQNYVYFVGSLVKKNTKNI